MAGNNFNPRLPRGRRPDAIEDPSYNLTISTHTSLAGGDVGRYMDSGVFIISTHTSLAGGDEFERENKELIQLFQPTSPSREATVLGYFKRMLKMISTHTSLAGGDMEKFVVEYALYKFQPTPPSREATAQSPEERKGSYISTHTSLAGGDG